MRLLVNGAILTDPGRQRSVNEDWCGSLLADPDESPPGTASVCIVADGVSGLGTGREAAHLAVDAFLSAGWDAPVAAPDRLLLMAAERANQRLWERGHDSTQPAHPYAAAIVAAVVRDQDAWIISAGDCRAYLLRAGAIRQITRDHTVAAEEVRQGRLRPEDVGRHPGRHQITRCLGQHPAVQPDVFHERTQPGDRLLLCSDGLTRHVDDEAIRSTVLACEPNLAARHLVDLANQGGGADNITVAILEFAAAPAVAPAQAPPAVTPAQASPAVTSAQAGPSDLGARRLALLQELGQRINASPELPSTLRSVLDSLIEITRAERACILLRDEQSGGLRFELGRNLDAAGIVADPAGGQHMVNSVFRDQHPLLIGDAQIDSRFKTFESVVAQSIRSVMCAPLIVRGACIGVVYADHSVARELFTHADLDLLMAFANIAAPAIENARLRERLEAQLHELGAVKAAQDRVLRSISSGIISVDPTGVVTSCNRAAGELLAIDGAALVGQPLSRVLPPSFMLALGAPFDGTDQEPGGTLHGFQMAGELPRRGYVAFEHRLSPLHDDNGAPNGYVLALDDRTNLARLERERREASDERERIMNIFGGLLSPDVLQEVLRLGAEGSGIGGDRRVLTIMFADIRGFTGLSERLPPEEVVAVLNGYLGAATEVILEHKGSIDKFIGDAVMALFGAPAPLEDHALQAVKAALAMQRRFAETPPPHGHRATFGIGINTGAGIVGTIGAPNIKSYTVIGDVVNVAARLQGEARAGEVLITSETYGLVADHVDVEEIGSIYVKGRVKPVAMYKVTGLRDESASAPVAAQNGAATGGTNGGS